MRKKSTILNKITAIVLAIVMVTALFTGCGAESTPAQNGLSAYELASLIYRSHEQVTAVDSPEEALEIGRLIAGKDGVIVAFGSTSLAWKLAAVNKSGLNTLEKKRRTNR